VTGIVAEVPVPKGEVEPDAAETRGNTKKKILTAAGVGVLGVLGTVAETRGWIAGWPPPAHSLRHPWIGYYTAMAADRIRRRSAGTAVAAGLAGNVFVESAQDAINSPDGFPFHWADVSHQSNHENLDNAVDLAMCLGGTALFLAQNNGLFSRARQRIDSLRSRLSGDEILAPAVEHE